MDKQTVVIIDVAHHGTTMVAGLCAILGISMVDTNYNEEKWEDIEIRKALRNDEQAFSAIVHRRNEQHDIWGFKVAGAWHQATLLQAHLRNPVYLAIYKDPVSVTQRRFGGVTANKLLNTIDQMKESIDGIKASGLPTHLLSYHRAVLSPAGFVAGLAGRIGVEPNSIQIDRAVRYIQPNRGSQKDKYPEIAPWI